MSTRAPEATTVRAPRPRILVCLPLFAAALGAAVPWILHGDARDARAGAAVAPAVRALAVGDLRLPLPDRWTPVARGPNIRAFGGARAVYARSYGGATAAIALVRATDPSLLPAKFAGAAGRPSVVNAGAMHAYLYVTGRGTAGELHVYVAPTTRGIAALACAKSDWAWGECDLAVRGLRLARGGFLPLNDESAFLARVPAVAGKLDDQRGRLRARLARAANSQIGARAADGLAVAYAAAGRALRPLVAKTGSAPAVVSLLDRLRDGHTALAAALRAHDPAGFAAAAGTIRHDEARLERRLTRFERVLRGARGR
jgi:hypothetical protein